jgi:asparagine synthase (glutamine-hydrolysing)
MISKFSSKPLRTLRNAAVTWSLSPQARSVMRSGLTYLSPQRLRVLERQARRITRAGIRGDFNECGVALGGSAILLASLLTPQRSFHGYDVFEMIPSPGPQDERDAHERYGVIKSGTSTGIGGHQYYGYVEKLYDEVVDSFRRHGLVVDNERICLHRGLFEQTLRFDPDSRVALAHIDCDWHDPVLLCLERIYARLSVGGCMILDDYNAWRGCRKAADAFLADKPDLVLTATRPNAIILRVAAH